MNYIFFYFLFIFLSTNLYAANLVPEEMIGTNRVEFAPMKVQDRLEGCSLTFNNIVRDQVYQNGAYVYVGGYISIYKNPKGVVFGIKVGTKNLEDSQPKKPNFAYLQTVTATTSKIKPEIFDIDGDGFKLFIYQFDDEIIKIYEEMLEFNKATIGFNRKSGGLDLMVPVDLTVKDVVIEDKKIKKIYSPEMVLEFSNCSIQIFEEALTASPSDTPKN